MWMEWIWSWLLKSMHQLLTYKDIDKLKINLYVFSCMLYGGKCIIRLTIVLFSEW